MDDVTRKNKERRVARRIIRIKDSKYISDENKKLILSYFEHIVVIEKVGLARQDMTLKALSQLILVFKDKTFKTLTPQDLIKYYALLSQERVIINDIYIDPNTKEFQHKFVPYSSEFIKTENEIIQKFYRWVRKNTPDLMDKMKVGELVDVRIRYKRERKLQRKDLLTQEERIAILNAAETPRDRAIIYLLDETGCRSEDIVTLTIGDLEFDKYEDGSQICRVNFHGDKTEYSKRKVPILTAVPAIIDWLNHHPDKDNCNAPLFVARYNKGTKPMACNSVYMILKRLAERAQIKKKVWTHLYRHTRGTENIKIYKPAICNKIMGWSPNSRMPAVYGHLVDEDVEEAFAQIHGLKHNTKMKENVLIPRECPFCHEKNDALNKYCNNCKAILDVKLAVEKQERMDNVRRKKDVEQAALILEMMSKLKHGQKLTYNESLRMVNDEMQVNKI